MIRRRPEWPLIATLVIAGLMWVGCSDGLADPTGSATTSRAGDPEPAVAPTADPSSGEAAPAPPVEANPQRLSAWGQLVVADGRLSPAPGVTPYGLNSALFSDYAHKLRTISAPGPADYHDTDAFDFPVGTVITKTFYYPLAKDGSGVLKVADPGVLHEPLVLAEVRLIETRVLVHRAQGWVALPYVWNEDQTQATLARTGDLTMLTLVDDAAGTETEFPYVVPNTNQCAGCHATNHTTKVIVPIGPKARHLNTDVDLGRGPTAQLAAWTEQGLLSGAPAGDAAPRAADWADAEMALDERARAYLDINCAHCHNRVGPADTSALFLEASTELGTSLGVCKAPIAAGTGTGGRRVGISPGRAEDSIFVYRMATDDPGAMMPELGRAVPHAEGVDLISTWIDSLTGTCP